MKLKQARVTRYKSILDSESFRLEDLACFVGKNESGKTAVLEALEKLNAAREERGDFHETDYPRMYAHEYSTGAIAVRTTWELSDEEAAQINLMTGSSKALSTREVVLSKTYGNDLLWEVPLDHKTVVSELLTAGSLSASEQEGLSGSTTPADLIARLRALPNPTPKQNALLESVTVAVGQTGDIDDRAEGYLRHRLPKFVYYAEYDRLPGKISVETLLARQANHRVEDMPGGHVFLALLNMVGMTLEDLVAIDTSEALISKLESVQSRMSRTLFDYWSQNQNLKVRFSYNAAVAGDEPPYNTGKVFQTRIENTRHEASISLNERSTGFIWFFSFLVWFSQVQSTYGENLIVLLDEPGLSLHARAQSDLLRYIKEQLLSKYQVLYTTHSSFMIDATSFDSCLTVEDKTGANNEVLGTKVNSDALLAQGDTLLPIRTALGWEITQSLFIGENVLVVEGPSDLYYLQWASHQLQNKGKVGLDPRWTIAIGYGVSKISSFVSLLTANNLHVAALVDYAKDSKQQVEALQKSPLLPSGHVFLASDYSENRNEADTEDMLGRSFYIELINKCYGLQGSDQLPATQPKDVPQRVVSEVGLAAKHWSATYDHYQPSLYLKQNPETVTGPTKDAALGRFENLFNALNALL